jgi:hypothetical protein
MMNLGFRVDEQQIFYYIEWVILHYLWESCSSD